MITLENSGCYINKEMFLINCIFLLFPFRIFFWYCQKCTFEDSYSEHHHPSSFRKSRQTSHPTPIRNPIRTKWTFLIIIIIMPASSQEQKCATSQCRDDCCFCNTLRGPLWKGPQNRRMEGEGFNFTVHPSCKPLAFPMMFVFIY